MLTTREKKPDVWRASAVNLSLGGPWDSSAVSNSIGRRRLRDPEFSMVMGEEEEKRQRLRLSLSLYSSSSTRTHCLWRWRRRRRICVSEGWGGGVGGAK